MSVLARILRYCLALTVLLFQGPARAQDLPLLGREHTRLITQEVSGDAAYEHIRYQTMFHRPGGGANGLWAVAEYVEAKAREFGLADVQLIKQAYGTRRPWNATFADLWIVEPEPERVASTLQSALHLADYSRRADVTGELIDIGAGRPTDYEGVAVAGKVVLTHGSISAVMREAVVDRGALGIVWYPDPFGTDQGTSGAGLSRPDQLRWQRIPADSVDGGEPTWAFGISARQGVALRQRLSQSREPIVVHAVVDAAFSSAQGDEPWQVMVEAVIPGTERDLGQDIVLTGHMQEEGFSANDDASGVASTLEVARALQRLIADGRLPRPRRTLRFWWVTEISSQRQYFADHPTAHESLWVNINQDMVGANQAQDIMRKQNITRLPATRFHFFNDVVESVIDYMVATNTYELAQAQAGSGLYTDPHTAHLGSLHRYNAEMIFFHTSSDHMPFNEAPIGVPGVSFTNMPDRYIHSSDDDLWNVDRTQLGRNAAAVALIAYIMATADDSDLGILAAETVGRGAMRLGENLRLALSWIATAEDKHAAYLQAIDQVRYAADRERMALRSLAEIVSGADALCERLLDELRRREEQAVRDVDLVYRETTGDRPPQRHLTSIESQLADVRPQLTAGPSEFLAGRGVRGVPGLHTLMGWEILNAVNGERTGLDIARFIAGEAREAGAHYYGVVTPQAVLQYLENARDAGLIGF